MICAGDVEHHRATYAVFLCNSDSGFHVRQLARDDDLIRRIDVGDIDIFIRGEPAHIIFQATNHSRHPALRCCARCIHEFAALLHELQPCCKIERARRCVRGDFP